MKILIIKDKRGYFINKNNKFDGMLSIGKDDIFHLMSLILDNDVEMDEISLSNSINNDAEKIIYENIYAELKKVVDNKVEINKDIDSDFFDIEKKYFQQDEWPYIPTIQNQSMKFGHMDIKY